VVPPPPPSARRSPSFDRWSNPSATPSGVETPADPLGLMQPSLKDKVQRFITEKPALAIGGASCVAALLLGIGLIAAASGGSSKPKTLATTSASATTMGEVPTPPAPIQVKTPPPPSLGDPDPLPAAIDVSANAPIARIQLGKRAVDMEVPAPTVAVELTPDDNGPLAVVATSSDGRVANGSWNEGDPDLQLAFGDAPAAPPVVAAPPHPRGGKGKGGKRKR
jgi:hypothetical protein